MGHVMRLATKCFKSSRHTYHEMKICAVSYYTAAEESVTSHATQPWRLPPAIPSAAPEDQECGSTLAAGLETLAIMDQIAGYWAHLWNNSGHRIEDPRSAQQHTCQLISTHVMCCLAIFS
ncbi:uncharacterized protein [Dermacentor andersoni]|uniref:uncharacterized protein isoform X2 n=1 Tax=Dermacentor andersoni TaxID=34620 RepID=UPI002417294E|nr:uncharacterized protein LOC126541772 isoform X2 [Dermacentor andersoni]